MGAKILNIMTEKQKDNINFINDSRYDIMGNSWKVLVFLIVLLFAIFKLAY